MKRLILLALVLASSAGAATIHIVEANWTLGGPLTVDGTGTDGDADNVLALAELTSLTAVYDIAGGGTLTWDHADFLLGAFGIGPFSGTYLFLAQNPGGAAVIASAGSGSSSAQVSDARIGLQDTASGFTAVPEPSTFTLPGAGLLLAAAARFRKAWSARTRPSSK
ncbi:PEP-CTERM sorting domain-containing protein [Paludibaculum fermentans]|uniref:PEP-CTERM sorting domain-containing protein n=1 Tax=Paludibaculum fermentans TaxID=1473598 RepID=UPI003EBD23CD